MGMKLKYCTVSDQTLCPAMGINPAGDRGHAPPPTLLKVGDTTCISNVPPPPAQFLTRIIMKLFLLVRPNPVSRHRHPGADWGHVREFLKCGGHYIKCPPPPQFLTSCIMKLNISLCKTKACVIP